MKVGNVPSDFLATAVRMDADPYTVTRVPQTKSSLGEMVDDTANASTHEILLDVNQPRERVVEDERGERIESVLDARTLPSEDLIKGDRIDHGSATYECDNIVGVPSDEHAVIYDVTFVRRTVNE